MAEYNPSKIVKDGNTYNFRDTTKIPLAGSNQISGSLIPATDNSIDIGSSTNNIKTLYTKGITIDGKTIDTDANGNMTFDGHIVDTIEEQGTGYIRYSNGIQICYGKVQNNSNVATGRTRFSFSVAFNKKPFIVTTPAIEYLYIVTVVSESVTDGILSVFDGSGGGSPAYTTNGILVNYVAIGKWK